MKSSPGISSSTKLTGVARGVSSRKANKKRRGVPCSGYPQVAVEEEDEDPADRRPYGIASLPEHGYRVGG
jgi:hypothetical protein